MLIVFFIMGKSMANSGDVTLGLFCLGQRLHFLKWHMIPNIEVYKILKSATCFSLSYDLITCLTERVMHLADTCSALCVLMFKGIVHLNI